MTRREKYALLVTGEWKTELFNMIMNAMEWQAIVCAHSLGNIDSNEVDIIFNAGTNEVKENKQ